MRPRQGLFGAGRFLLGMVLLMTGCGDDASLPVAPTTVPSASTSQSMAAPTTVPMVTPEEREEGVTLKATRPMPMNPPNETEINEVAPLLVASSSDGFVEVDFGYEFEVYAEATGALVEDAPAIVMPESQGSGHVSYRVATRLDLGATYRWRVRAVLEDAFDKDADEETDALGPWSRDAFFSIAPVAFGAPVKLRPIDKVVNTRPLFKVHSGVVEGDPERVVIQLRVTPDDTQPADEHIAGEAEAGAAGGQEVRITLRNDYQMTSDTGYVWQARTVAHKLSRMFTSDWSDDGSFKTEVQRLGRPGTSLPEEGGTVGARPVLVVENGAVEGNVGRVFIEVEVNRKDGSERVSGRAEMQGGEGGETSVRLQETLQPEAPYSWMARAIAPDAPFGPVESEWSAPATFMTDASTSLGPVVNPPPNLLHVVQGVANRYPDELRAAIAAGQAGVSSGLNDPDFQFLYRVVEALRAADGGRWGVTYWTNDHTPEDRLSKDRVGYYLGDENSNPHGSPNMRVIEFLFWLDGSMFWYDSTNDIRRNHPEAHGQWRNPPG